MVLLAQRDLRELQALPALKETHESADLAERAVLLNTENTRARNPAETSAALVPTKMCSLKSNRNLVQ